MATDHHIRSDRSQKSPPHTGLFPSRRRRVSSHLIPPCIHLQYTQSNLKRQKDTVSICPALEPVSTCKGVSQVLSLKQCLCKPPPCANTPGFCHPPASPL